MLLHGEPGVVDFIADPAQDPDDWYVKEYGGGVMIHEPKCFGYLFDNTPADSEGLEFVTRADGYCSQPPPSAL